jgi:hypothetical protein
MINYFQCNKEKLVSQTVFNNRDAHDISPAIHISVWIIKPFWIYSIWPDNRFDLPDIQPNTRTSGYLAKGDYIIFFKIIFPQ